MINFHNLQDRIAKTLEHPIVRGTLWKFSARFVGLFIQSAYFLIVARSLGVEQYGLFLGVMALVKVLVPFANWGTPHILVKQVSRNREVFRAYWGNALWVTAILGSLFLVGLLFLNQFVLPTQFPWFLVLTIGLSELLFARFHDAALKSFLATDLVRLDAQLNMFLSIAGLVAAVCLPLWFEQPDANIWGVFYLLSRIVSAGFGILLVNRKLGTPQPKLALMKPEIHQGLFFSIDLSSQTIYNDIDKTLLTSMSTLAIAGNYGAAYRLVMIGLTPIIALLGATYANFFRKGASGIRGSLQFARRIMPVSIGYGLLASIATWAIAPIVPLLLGEEYAGSVEALRWLSPLILLKAMQLFAADTLTGAGLQGARSALQASIAMLNLCLNLWLIPLYSWKGAAIASLVSDGLLMLCLWGLVGFFYRKQTAPQT